MTQHDTLNVKLSLNVRLSNPQLNKSKPGIENGLGAILNF